MKVYVNNQHRICAVHTTTDHALTELDIPDTVFSKETTEELIKCYSCRLDEDGNYMIQLLVPPDMADQINQSGLQHKADQETITDLQLALVDQYENNALLDESVTNNQMAIIQLYEGGTL